MRSDESSRRCPVSKLDYVQRREMAYEGHCALFRVEKANSADLDVDVCDLQDLGQLGMRDQRGDDS